MKAEDFVNHKDRLKKEYHGKLLTFWQYAMRMHMLFIESKTSRGLDDDVKLAEEIYTDYVKTL